MDEMIFTVSLDSSLVSNAEKTDFVSSTGKHNFSINSN